MRAIDGVSLTIARGELVVLYGPSGSGKTTLVKLIAALIHADRGLVLVGGRDVGRLSDDEASHYRLHDLGLVLQTFHMMAGLSALANAALRLVACGLPHQEAEDQVEPLLNRLGLVERANQRATDLSMGERQRLALARALSTDPGLVVADEPTGNLDTDRGRDVLELLAEVAQEHNAAVLVVTHDPQAATLADRVLTLRDGRLVDDEPASNVRPATSSSQ
ncbi:MAG TPA: ABC transporter ATP-binding protein [Thermoleophilaceae bacterium]